MKWLSFARGDYFELNEVFAYAHLSQKREVKWLPSPYKSIATSKSKVGGDLALVKTQRGNC